VSRTHTAHDDVGKSAGVGHHCTTQSCLATYTVASQSFGAFVFWTVGAAGTWWDQWGCRHHPLFRQGWSRGGHVSGGLQAAVAPLGNGGHQHWKHRVWRLHRSLGKRRWGSLVVA